MEYILMVTQALLLLAIAGGIILGKYYFPAYLQKKGENLATKQDIDQITARIESVKSVYASELEKLKSSLQISVQKFSAFAASRREALLAFFESCLILIDVRIRKAFTELSFKEQFEYEEQLNQHFDRVYIDYHRLILYFPEKSDLTEQGRILVDASLRLHSCFDHYFGRLRKDFRWKEKKTAGSGMNMDLYPHVDFTPYVVEGFDENVRNMNLAFQHYLQALNSYLLREGLSTLPEFNRYPHPDIA